MVAIPFFPGEVFLSDLESIWRQEWTYALHECAKPAVDASAACQNVSTLQNSAQHQRSLILSHCIGTGEPASRQIVEFMMMLKLISLGRGTSGVRWEVLMMIENMVNQRVMPIVRVPIVRVPGASSDLATLAHLAAVMIGEGEATHRGRAMPGGQALREAGLAPVVLSPNESLALITGAQYSIALALAGLFGAWRAAQSALAIAALSTEAIMGPTRALDADIHALCGHRGHIEAADAMRALLAKSMIQDSTQRPGTSLQEPDCIRDQPLVTGAAMDLLQQAGQTLKTEANAAPANIVVLAHGEQSMSGGHDAVGPVDFAATIIAQAITEIGAISRRRVALMADPTLQLALPTDPMPNPVPNGSHAAWHLPLLVANLERILGIELLCATQGVERLAPLQTSPALQALMVSLKHKLQPLGQDRTLVAELEKAEELVRDGTVVEAIGIAMPKLSG